MAISDMGVTLPGPLRLSVRQMTQANFFFDWPKGWGRKEVVAAPRQGWRNECRFAEGAMTEPARPNPTGNQILDRLPAGEARALLSSARSVSLPQGHEVYRQDG